MKLKNVWYLGVLIIQTIVRQIVFDVLKNRSVELNYWAFEFKQGGVWAWNYLVYYIIYCICNFILYWSSWSSSLKAIQSSQARAQTWTWESLNRAELELKPGCVWAQLSLWHPLRFIPIEQPWHYHRRAFQRQSCPY